MTSKPWIAGAVLLEPLSWAATAEGGRWAVALGLLLHGAAAACAAVGLGARAEGPARPALVDVLVLFAFGCFVPLAGVPLVLLGGVRALRPAPVADAGPPTREYDIPDLPKSASAALRLQPFGGRSLAAVVRRGREPSLRLRAVIAAGKLRDPAGVALLSEALRDRDDEVRLLAYALLDGAEREIYGRIQVDKARLAEAAAGEGARLHAALAQHHWELVELGLAQGDVASHLLAIAGEHAGAALELAPEDGGTRLLLGRVQLRLGRLAEAEADFLQAIESGLCEEVVRPLLAEVAFQRRSFEQVRAHVQALGQGRRGLFAVEVVRFWS